MQAPADPLIELFESEGQTDESAGSGSGHKMAGMWQINVIPIEQVIDIGL